MGSIRHLLSREYQLLISGQNTFQNCNGWKPLSSCWRELTTDELPETLWPLSLRLGIAPVCRLHRLCIGEISFRLLCRRRMGIEAR